MVSAVGPATATATELSRTKPVFSGTVWIRLGKHERGRVPLLFSRFKLRQNYMKRETTDPYLHIWVMDGLG